MARLKGLLPTPDERMFCRVVFASFGFCTGRCSRDSTSTAPSSSGAGAGQGLHVAREAVAVAEPPHEHLLKNSDGV